MRDLLLICLISALWLPQAVPAQGTGQDIADEIFYHFMPICWRDSDQDTYRFGDFAGMTASLDYLQTLGVTAIWMNPIFPSPAYHGYQHGPADTLNPRFGTEADLEAFLEAAHLRGIKVFVDFVAYGISHDSVYFQDAFNNPGSAYDSWLAFTNSGNTEYLGATFPTWNGDTVGFIHWDLRDPGPVNLVTQWAQHWLDPDGNGVFTDGLDGYRLDHVWQYYPNGPDGWGYHLDSFWAPWREALRSVNPDVFVFAEQANWGSHGAELLTGLDAAFTKPFEFAARDALSWETAGPLYGQMAATVASLSGAPEGGTYLSTIGNHDVNRLASVIGDGFAKGKAAAAVLLTQPYAPVIYYGDEIGMRGTKNSGYLGDAADIPMREPFKWNAVAGPPMTNYWILNAEAYANRFAQDNDGRSVVEQLDVSGSLLEAYRDLIAARRSNIALRRGQYLAVSSEQDGVWSFVRDHPDQQILVTINLTSQARLPFVQLAGFGIPGGETTPVDLITGLQLPPLTDANQDAYPVSLSPYGYRILQVDLIAPEPARSLVDGREIPNDFGPQGLLETQDNATGLGDNVSELDQLFCRVRNDSLFMGLTGNLASDGSGLCLLFDTSAGGQTVLDLANVFPPPSGPDLLTGTRLDTGFAPDHLIFLNAFGGQIYVDQYELLTGGGADKTYRGQGTVGDGDGLLLGGINPLGLQIALDNSNSQGVTDEDASGAATATEGFELFIPLADIGLDDGTPPVFMMAAFLMTPDGQVSNQWFPGLGGGWDNLGLAPNLATVPGEQFLLVDTVTAVPEGEPEQSATGVGTLGLKVVGVAEGHPFASPLSFAFLVPQQDTAGLAIYDLRGRRVRTLLDGALGSGDQVITFDGRDDRGARLPSAVYFARLEVGSLSQTARFVLIR